MVPRLAAAGKSFTKAGAYFLHDKRAGTSQRVAFTHTHNMLTDNAASSLKVMAWTAMNQRMLKRFFYRSQNPDDPQCRKMNKAGRPTKTSVMHYSLSWHPSESPEPEHMIEAAKATLEQLDLSEHECLMVAHNDEPQPHIHVIVNKIHPETGRVAPLKYTKHRLSKWAKAYQLEHGKIWCKSRFAKEGLPEPDAEHTQKVINAIAAALMAGDAARQAQQRQKFSPLAVVTQPTLKQTRQKTEPEPRKDRNEPKLSPMFNLAKRGSRPYVVYEHDVHHHHERHHGEHQHEVVGLGCLFVGSEPVGTSGASGQGSSRRSADHSHPRKLRCLRPPGYDPRRSYALRVP